MGEIEEIEQIIQSIGINDAPQNRMERLFEKFEGDLTGLYDRAIKKYKDQDVLVKGTKQVLKEQKELLDSREKKLESTKNFVDIIMKSNNETKVESKYGKISYRKSTKTIVDEEVVFDKYKKTKEVVEIDKIKIKEDIKAGIDVIGAYLEETFNLNIK